MTAPLVNGFRLGFGVAMIGVLLAETKLSNQGIGFMIINAYARFDMPQMYALLIVTIAFAAFVNAFAVRMARRFGAQTV
jgi:NitT/TauT family transport system permease protein